MKLNVRKVVLIAVIASFGISSPLAYADRFAPPQLVTVTSQNKAYELQIIPADNSAKTLSKGIVKNVGSGETKEFQLVNHASPVSVFVSDEGNVVTIDEWYSRGYAHVVVIYDQGGKVLKDYSLEEILTGDEIKRHVKQTVSNRWWLRGPDRSMTPDEAKKHEEWRKSLALWAKVVTKFLPTVTSDEPKYSFSKNENTFVAETGWGKVLKFDLT